MLLHTLLAVTGKAINPGIIFLSAMSSYLIFMRERQMLAKFYQFSRK